VSIAYLGLGANLGDKLINIERALRLLSGNPGVRMVSVSRVYKTSPVGGPPNQPDYYNAVAAVECTLQPRELLSVCLAVERKLGRRRKACWGPRSIDLDILLFGDGIIDEPGLIIPHPRLRERLFVLVPLAEIIPFDQKLPPDFINMSDAVELVKQKNNLADEQHIQVIETGIELSELSSENLSAAFF
jgi:2-amino-4-hydroxy-6-hydroxymethyldihydropteridine diphosphokinase